MKKDKIRTYNRDESIVFRKTKEKFGGLSNMAPNFPIEINEIQILTSEALYQACRFPHFTEIQKLIINQKGPMTAKIKSKSYRNQTRSDWNKTRINIMRWCLKVKLVCNWKTFGQLLLSTENKPIVEDSSHDQFWGTIPIKKDILVGQNILGRLLMELRQELNENNNALKTIKPLSIPNFTLLNKQIPIINANNLKKSPQKQLALPFLIKI